MLTQPLPVIAQVLELPTQATCQRRQMQRQRFGLRATRQHHLQVDEVLLQGLLAVIPLGQLDALTQRHVIEIRRRQVQVELETAALTHALARQRQLVEVLGDARGVQVLGIVATAIQFDVFGPAEQIFQAEQQQPALAGAFLDALGALALTRFATRRGFQIALTVFTTVGGLRLAEVFRRVQPQRQRPGRALAARELADAARLAQRLTQRSFQRGLALGQLARIRAQCQMGLDQPLIAWAHGGKLCQQLLGPALVVTRPVAHFTGLRCEQRQPAVEILVQRGLGVHREALRKPKVVAITPGHRQLFAGTGDLLQQVAPQQHVPRCGSFDTDAAGPAHRAKQQGQRALHAFQLDARLGEVRAGAAGDEAVPDTADPLFHFDGKGHGGLLRTGI